MRLPLADTLISPVAEAGISSSPTQAIEATESPWSSLNIVTPCAALPVLRISERFVLSTLAFEETT